MQSMHHASGFALLLCGQIHLRARRIGIDEAIARLAAVQFGVVSRAQLLTLGLSRRAIEHRIATGRLRRVYRGVYAVGHDVLEFRGRVMAALLATGPGSAASHRTAAALGGAELSTEGPIHVTTRHRRAPQPGIALHRGVLPPDEITFVDEMPVTTMARTFLDLSRTEHPRVLRRLIKSAEFKGQVNWTDLDRILERYPRRQGRGPLAELARSVHAKSGRTRSEIEDLLTEFVAARSLPAPERNVQLHLRDRTIEVDCLWREARVALELDGRSAHDRAIAFEDDRARDRALTAARWIPLRATWAQLRYEPDALEADLRPVVIPARAGTS